VADLAIGLLLSIARRIPQADRFVRANEWPAGPIALGRKVTGSRLGVVGMGRIGQAIAHRARAFDMEIAYTARSPRSNLDYRHYPDAESLAAAVDFLVVITPGGAATRGLIDARVLKALGPEGYLVNVARGSVVDQPALIDALRDGVIAGAALDVFANEPQVPEALRAMSNVVLTPHIGSATKQTREAMGQLTLGNLEAHFAGAPLLTPVEA
jgi:lactate dehydrogenase-like 2-hydroxyacid dehydrogenase